MLLILSLASFLISLFAVALIKQRWGQQLLDLPNERSSHCQPTPRGGGLGFIVAFACTSLIATPAGVVAVLWLVLVPLAIVGIVDDRQGVSALIRYLVHLAAASIAVFAFGSFPFPWLDYLGGAGQILAFLLTVIAFTAFINFYNFMDGLDGLVAGTTAVQLSFLALYLNQPVWWLLVAALFGFLWWNWSPAQIFMGDAGSTVLGATVAIALLNVPPETVAADWSALGITLPLIGDAVYTLCRRLWRGETIFQAHRTHLYQRLQLSGWSHSQVATAYIGMNLFVALSIGFWGAIGTWLALAGVIAAIVIGEYLQRQSSKQAVINN